MPPGLELYAVGLVCLLIFAALAAHENQRGITVPARAGWLLLAVSAGCLAGGTIVLAVSLFSH
jgi:hypothetical protein